MTTPSNLPPGVSGGCFHDEVTNTCGEHVWIVPAFREMGTTFYAPEVEEFADFCPVCGKLSTMVDPKDSFGYFITAQELATWAEEFVIDGYTLVYRRLAEYWDEMEKLDEQMRQREYEDYLGSADWELQNDPTGIDCIERYEGGDS